MVALLMSFYQVVYMGAVLYCSVLMYCILLCSHSQRLRKAIQEKCISYRMASLRETRQGRPL